MKKISVFILIMCLIFSISGCSFSKDSLNGKWEYDTSEMQDPDMKGFTIEFKKDMMYLSNYEEGTKVTVEAKYEKDDSTIFITNAQINGEELDMGNDGEFLQIPYKLLDGKLMLEIEDVGKIILKKV